MTLHLIGIGLENEQDITVRALDVVKNADYMYLETYTSKLACDITTLEKFYGKKIILASRATIEQEEELITRAKTHSVCLLIIGDALSATTHVDILLRAREQNIPTTIIQNTSIMTAVAQTGLQLYKFGKTASIPYNTDNYNVETYYDILKQNQTIGAHTLFLLDIKPPKYMTIQEGIAALLAVEKKRKEKIITEKTLFIGCARLGWNNQLIKKGTATQLQNINFGEPPHCLIIPSQLHFMEEEYLERVSKNVGREIKGVN